MSHNDEQENNVTNSNKNKNKREIEFTECDSVGAGESIKNHSVKTSDNSGFELLEESNIVDTDGEYNFVRFHNKIVKLAFMIVLGIFFSVMLFIGYSYYRETVFLKDLSYLYHDNFVFYYPKEFVQNKNSDVELDYKSPYTNQRGFSSTIRFFNIESLNKASKIKDKETCKLFVEGKIDNASNENMDTDNQGYTIEKLEFDNFFGKKTCFFIIKYDMAKLFDNEMLTGQYIIAEAKVIVIAEKAIGVYANYDDITIAEERDALSRSIIFFDSR
ncbi:MAG: hypothetical protein KatS3mg083_022 [Candidatus Dojkabacteria bacterium]|nr:MAG: hypothetical protein KatS3mg083_022 [Candidatus Dojkabacteria bacterium]